VRILYVSELLAIHDQMVMDRLVRSGVRLSLVTAYPKPELPAGITALPIDIHHLYLPPRSDPRRYLRPDVVLPAVRTTAGRALRAVAGRGEGAARFAGWEHSRLGMRALHAAAALRGEQLLALLRRVLARERPDVLHGCWVQTAGFACAVSGYRPFMLAPYASDVLIEPDRSAWAHAATRYTLQAAGRVACDCQHVAQRAVELGLPEERVLLFPRGVDVERFQPGARDPDLVRRHGLEPGPVLVMTRRLRPVYGVEDFLRALPPVLAAHPGLRVLLAGEGPLEGELKRLATSLGLDGAVLWLGSVPNEDLPRYLRTADVYVSTSHSDGSSVSLLEAMCCGLPAVVTDVPAIREWIEEGAGGRRVPIGDPAGIARGLLDVLADQTRLRAMGARNLALAQERVDWRRCIRDLIGAYEGLVAGARAPRRVGDDRG
jgi:L-malate glycosyltransferase